MAESVFLPIDSVDVPYSLEAEQAVLGCVLIDPACIKSVLLHLKADHFYIPQHKSIFGVIKVLDSQGVNIDPVVILDHLKRDGVYDDASGKNYLFNLAQMVPSVENVENYIRIVLEKFYLRELVSISRNVMKSASDAGADANELLEFAEQKIYDLRQGKKSEGPTRLSDVISSDVLDTLNKLNSPNKEEYLGVPTGFSTLDKVITGLHKSDLIVIGARPGMGKTSFALNLCRNVGMLAKKKVLFFSLEMSKEQLAQRLLSSEARIPSSKMRTGELNDDEWVRLSHAMTAFAGCEIYLDDTANTTAQEMKAKIRRLGDVDLVIIDYLQLMKSGGKYDGNRVQEVSEITRNLKLMAKDLRIPVITCSQLSRGLETRGKSHKPQLSDLRESGSIEQDADIVMLLYREAYYKNDAKEGVELDQNSAQLGVEKNRHGGTITIDLHFEPQFTRFTAVERVRDEE
ncbi:MAG: replicative DNA helicase [Clostridia bacterium]|nr:replicative DNA helicase [Clostridia bacterium]